MYRGAHVWTGGTLEREMMKARTTSAVESGSCACSFSRFLVGTESTFGLSDAVFSWRAPTLRSINKEPSEKAKIFGQYAVRKALVPLIMQGESHRSLGCDAER